MFGCIKLIRIISSVVVSLILAFVIIVGIPLSAFFNIISNEDGVKLLLEKSDFYEKVIDFGVDKYLNQADEELKSSSSFFTKEEFVQIISNSVAEEIFQEISENIIDSLYRFSKGEADELKFSIDISSHRDSIKGNIETELNNKFNSLPVCSSSIDYSSDFNPFEYECRPNNFDQSEMISIWADEILNNFPLLSDSDFNQDDLKIEPTLVNSFKTMYKSVRIIVIVIYSLIALISIILFLDVSGFSTKIMVVGAVWFVSGLALIGGGYYAKNNPSNFFELLLEKFNISQVDDELIEFMNGFISVLVSSIIADTSKIVIIMTVLGMVLIFGAILSKMSKNKIVTYDFEKDMDPEEKPEPKEIFSSSQQEVQSQPQSSLPRTQPQPQPQPQPQDLPVNPPPITLK